MKKRRCIKKMKLFFWLVPIFVLGAYSGVSAGLDSPKRALNYKALKKAAINSGSNKVSSSLIAVRDEIKARGITKQNAKELGASGLSNPLVRVSEEGSIQAYIYVHTFGSEEKALLEKYEVIIEIVNEKFGIVQAWIPSDRIDEVAQLPFVKRITPPSYGKPRVGSVTTEGDAILRADELRAKGLSGKGVKVGVISDGKDNQAFAQATGDLPQDITTQTYSGEGDEGTALLEIVHDLAPGAELGFCGPETSLEMITCVNDLADSSKFGADIIVDDVGFPLEPYFEDGPVAQAVASLPASVTYASSAGNAGMSHHEADFYPTFIYGYYDPGPPERYLPEHNFGLALGPDSDPNMDALVGPGGVLFVVLQWNDPFGGSGNDYDLEFYDKNDQFRLTCVGGFTCGSYNFQEGTGDPWEALVYQNTSGDTVRVKIEVYKWAGEDKRLEFYVFGSNNSLIEHNVPAGSIFGHPAVPGVLATGAINAADPGNDTIESFSSRGPVEIYFPTRQTRQKPDVTAIDGVSVTGAGGFPSPFLGTSASAPHVAGVAALLRGRCKKATTAQIADALKTGAVDLGTAGTDNTYGAGRIDAVEAYNILKLEGLCTTFIPAVPAILLDSE